MRILRKIKGIEIKRFKPIVLEFHRVLPEKLITKTSGYFATETVISQNYFEKVLFYLKKEGYKFVTVAGLLKEDDINKCVALTFDDGYYDNFAYAYPVLKKFNATATFFPVVDVCRENKVLPLDIYYQIVEEMGLSEKERTEYYKGNIKKKFYWSEPKSQIEQLKEMFVSFPDKMVVSYMNAMQLKYLSDNGFEIGSHGLSHSILTADYMNEQKVTEELKNSKHWLEAITGKPVVTFCFPAGRYNEKIIELVKAVGYTSTCLVNRDAKIPEVIPSYQRINVKQDSFKELKNSIKNIERERTVIGRYYNRLKYRTDKMIFKI